MKLVLENRGKILQKEPEYLEKLLLKMIVDLYASQYSVRVG